MIRHERSEENPVLQFAEHYAKLGYAVFPCKRHAKDPDTPKGVKDASTDPKQVADWFGNPTLNVSLSCDGILVIDLDDSEHPWADREWPTGPVSRTPRGGWHRYFKKPEGVKNWNGKLAPGVDLKTDGGYVIEAPSRVVQPAMVNENGEVVKPAIDGEYSWTYQLCAREHLPDVPAWFLKELANFLASKVSTSPTQSPAGQWTGKNVGREVERAREYLAKCPVSISGQRGHDSALWAARVLVRGFMLSDADAWGLLLDWNQTCSPPWTEKELRHKLKESRDKPFDKPQGWLLAESPTATAKFGSTPPRAGSNPGQARPQASPPPAITVPECGPFPVEALPDSLALLVHEAALAADCDPAFVTMPCLSLIAGTIGGSLCISPKRGWYEAAPIWCVVIADSGTGKSPGQRVADDIVRSVNRELRDRLQREMAQYEQACLALERGDENPERPRREYYGVKDITFERLAENLQASPHGLLMNRDELADWFHSFARYKAKGSGTDAARWIGVWNADDISIERKSSDNGPREIYVERPTISVYGGIQPGIFAKVLQEDSYVSSGFAARLLLAYLPKRCPRYTDATVAAELVERFQTAIRTMRNWPAGEDRTPYVGLEHETRKVWSQFHDECADSAEGIFGGPMSAVWPKMPRHALRLALALHAYQCAESETDPVKTFCSPDTMARAITLAKWFAQQAERVYALQGETAEDRDLRHLAELVRRKGGTMTPRNLQKSSGRRYPSSESATLALESLVAAGLATCDITTASNGKTSGVYSLVRRPTLSDVVSEDES